MRTLSYSSGAIAAKPFGGRGVNVAPNAEAEEQEIVVRCRTVACQRRRYDLWRSNNQDRVALSLLGQGAEVLSLGIPLPGLGWFGRLCGCFDEGTLVATPNGLRRIEEIEIGDQVLAWNPETGETTTETVTALIRPEPKLLWRLEARDAGGGTETFFVTDDHPWFVEGVGWMETRHLAPGQRPETADDRGLTILDIAPTDRVARTLNLTVTGPHTFLVGENGAVVHNTANCLRFIIPAIKAAQLQRRGWTSSAIRNAIDNPVAVGVTVDRRTGQAATAYFVSSNQYVVRNNVTGEIVQGSNLFDPNWIVDRAITIVGGP